ncbi:MAG: hypothetical protein NT018_05035 [Armatimonadetes bacterium]|nr:hypothetical protein [Armatimonadota bacterium]
MKNMALVTIDDIDLLEQMLEALEDQLDMPIIKERLSEAKRGDTVSWETIKSRLKK